MGYSSVNASLGLHFQFRVRWLKQGGFMLGNSTLKRFIAALFLAA